MTHDPSSKTPEERLAFLEKVVEQIPHPLNVKDLAFQFVLANGPMCELMRKSRDELIGRTDEAFFLAEIAAMIREMDERVLSTRETLHTEGAFKKADGTVRNLAVTKAPMLDEAGEVTHLLTILHDITPIKMSEEALRLSNEALEARIEERTRELGDMQEALVRRERLAVLGQLAGGLAHQIRNPLGAMANAIAVVRRRLKAILEEDLEAAQAIAIVDEEIWEANRIITDLIDFARVRPPTRKRVTLRALVDAALGHARSDLAYPVTVTGDASLEVLVDERQCRDALANLVRNAFEAMSEEGRLTISCKIEDKFAVISLVDTGPGIAEAVAKRLFEPLNTTKPLGLGLGLATARSLLRNQGGELAAIPAEKGAHFEVRLPLAFSGSPVPSSRK